jgi:hypothetical protein
MNPIDTLKNTFEDFNTFKEVIKAKIKMNGTLLDIVERWFQNVEIKYPIAEMPLSADERAELAEQIVDEMLQHTQNGINALEQGGDPEMVFDKLASELDALWRELTGVYAEILNKGYRAQVGEIEPEKLREHLLDFIEQISEQTGKNEAEVYEYIRHNEHIRAQLRRLGIDPDTI